MIYNVIISTAFNITVFPAILAIFGIVAVNIVLFFMFFKKKLRKKHCIKLRKQPFPKQWLEYIDKNVCLYKRLSNEFKTQIKGNVQVLYDDLEFEGCGGLIMSEEIKITILAQASFLLLNRDHNYFGNLHTVIIYPDVFTSMVETFSPDGIKSINPRRRSGESWSSGTIVLAWNISQRGARNRKDANNVVLHEFSHQLDQEDGITDGVPILESKSDYASWMKICRREYGKLQKKVEKKRKTLIDPYAATEPWEFFAVVTETFFEKPKKLKRKHPELYQLFQGFYKLDPAEWR